MCFIKDQLSQFRHLRNYRSVLELYHTFIVNLKTYWGKVVEIAKEVLQLNPSVDFKHTPHANPHMERGEATRPDAMSFLIHTKMPDNFKKSSALYFCNVAILKEDKIADKPSEIQDLRVVCLESVPFS